MAGLVVNSLWNANVYLNGNNLLGRAAKFTVPQPKRKMQDYKGLGMASELEIQVGWTKLQSEITWSSFDSTTIAGLLNTLGMQQFRAEGDLQILGAAGLTGDTPVVYNVTGLVTDPGEIPFAAQENVNYRTTITVYHVDLSVGGDQVYLFDVFSNQFIVNGIDQLAAFRANTGG